MKNAASIYNLSENEMPITKKYQVYRNTEYWSYTKALRAPNTKFNIIPVKNATQINKILIIGGIVKWVLHLNFDLYG